MWKRRPLDCVPFSEIYFKFAVLSAREKEKLIELKTDSSLQLAFLEKNH